jgi:hypothetical protein
MVGTGAAAPFNPYGQGVSVALSGDGNRAVVGGEGNDGSAGAAWVFTRSAGVWSQHGPKLVGTGAVGNAYQGSSVALSADGIPPLLVGLATMASPAPLGCTLNRPSPGPLGRQTVTARVSRRWPASMAASMPRSQPWVFQRPGTAKCRPDVLRAIAVHYLAELQNCSRPCGKHEPETRANIVRARGRATIRPRSLVSPNNGKPQSPCQSGRSILSGLPERAPARDG